MDVLTALNREEQALVTLELVFADEVLVISSTSQIRSEAQWTVCYRGQEIQTASKRVGAAINEMLWLAGGLDLRSLIEHARRNGLKSKYWRPRDLTPHWRTRDAAITAPVPPMPKPDPVRPEPPSPLDSETEARIDSHMRATIIPTIGGAAAAMAKFLRSKETQAYVRDYYRIHN